jgi:hypothetical protein
MIAATAAPPAGAKPPSKVDKIVSMKRVDGKWTFSFTGPIKMAELNNLRTRLKGEFIRSKRKGRLAKITQGMKPQKETTNGAV